MIVGQGRENEGDPHNPWERDDSVKEVSDRIMSAPLSDDVKLALYARSVPEAPATWVGRKGRAAGRKAGGVDSEGSGEEEGEEEDGPTDFRTLRTLLHSDDILVKASRSLPDVAGVGKASSSLQRSNNYSHHSHHHNNNNNNKLTTILDLDEDEESVRVTTL